MTPRTYLGSSFIFCSISTINGAGKRIKYATVSVGEIHGHLFANRTSAVRVYPGDFEANTKGELINQKHIELANVTAY